MSDQHDPLARRITAIEEHIAALQQKLREEVALHQITVEAYKQARARIGALEQKLSNHLTGKDLAQISKIYPKSRTVIFVGIGFLGDNIKYAFFAFCKFAREHNIACYFLTEDTKQYEQLAGFGLPCIMPFTKKGTHEDFHILASTSVVVLAGYFHAQPGRASVSHALLQGAKMIQLWHGIPLKEIGLQSFSSAEIMAACGPFEALVATSLASRSSWAQRFSFHEFAALGYPRNDVFFRDLSPTDMINADRDNLSRAKAARSTGKPVVLYAPTFRNNGVEWLKKAELDKIGAHCQARGYAFYLNLHPAEQYANQDLQRQYPDIAFVASQTDIYPFVKFADVLVSDYSSLAFDFLLLDRPLVFYRPDHEDYITKSRPLIPGREHYASGPLASSFEEFPAALDAAVKASRHPQSDPYREARQALRKELFDHCDGKAAERVCKLIAKYLDAS
jgi:CDP-glycerol glycerophosphotransferase